MNAAYCVCVVLLVGLAAFGYRSSQRVLHYTFWEMFARVSLAVGMIALIAAYWDVGRDSTTLLWRQWVVAVPFTCFSASQVGAWLASRRTI